jgi:hypothetical protein
MLQLNRLICITTVVIALWSHTSAKIKIESKSGIRVFLDDSRQSFLITVAHPRWTFGGNVEGTLSGEHAVKGKDRIGVFEEIVFTSREEISYRCRIRTYENRSIILFEQESLDSLTRSPRAFPVFSKVPDRLSL